MIYGYKKAFSMLELIFVIIILGIVSSIGAEIIANVYEQYIIQRAQHRASIKTELAATQIANRLAYAIPGTVFRRVVIPGFSSFLTDINEPGTGTENLLQWVGADMDSFKSMSEHPSDTAEKRRPGWSGFCDVSASSGTTISTPGSNLVLAKDIINNLGGDIKTAQLYFPIRAGLSHYAVASTNTIDQVITLDTPLGSNDTITEHYKLAWTSYALLVDASGTLSLYYNFSPIKKINHFGVSQILLRNVSTFKFRGDGRTIRFKLCIDEQIGEDFNITSCKEKAVF